MPTRVLRFNGKPDPHGLAFSIWRLAPREHYTHGFAGQERRARIELTASASILRISVWVWAALSASAGIDRPFLEKSGSVTSPIRETLTSRILHCKRRTVAIGVAQLDPVIVAEIKLGKVTVQVLLGTMLIVALHAALKD